MLHERVRQCGVWRRLGVDLGVAVNVSALDLLERRLRHGDRSSLRERRVPASALTLEITEGAFVQEPDRVRRTLEALRALGVQVAIDDFGTGYSSLGYLKELPVDVLKIDRSFVSDLLDSEASTAIVRRRSSWRTARPHGGGGGRRGRGAVRLRSPSSAAT